MADAEGGKGGELAAHAKSMIGRWHAIESPNQVGDRLVAELEGVIRAFEGVRDRGTFGEEPADFTAALHDLRDEP